MHHFRRTGLLLLLTGLVLTADGRGQPAGGYTPAAPPAALVAALRSQWKVVGDWVAERDFASAAQAARCLKPLTDLAAVQSDQADWTNGITQLRSRHDALSDAIRRKDAGAAEQARAAAGQVLDVLAKLPAPAQRSVANFQFPGGSVKTWMSLLDGAYVDAKSARTPQDLEMLAGALAEEGNALAHMRTDARWKADSLALRATAAQAAAQTRAGELEAARKTLKDVYASCESCHDRSRRK